MRGTMLRAILAPAFALLFAVALLQAQTATVFGTITRKNGKAATNVVVVIAGKSNITGIDGRYRIDDVPVGRQKMQIKQGKNLQVTMNVVVEKAGGVIDQKLPW